MPLDLMSAHQSVKLRDARCCYAKNGDDRADHRRFGAGTNLLVRRVVHLLHRLVHVLVRFLNRIELLLLLRREERTDLRRRVVHHGAHLLHRFLVDRPNLRSCLIDDRADLRLLVGREVEIARQMFQRVVHSAAVAAVRTGAGIFSTDCDGAEREGGSDAGCNKFQFHLH